MSTPSWSPVGTDKSTATELGTTLDFVQMFAVAKSLQDAQIDPVGLTG